MALHNLMLPFLFVLSFNNLPSYSNRKEDPALGCSDPATFSGTSACPPHLGTLDRRRGTIAYKPSRFILESYNLVGSSESAEEVVNVMDYGAKGDGTDDTMAFEKAWEVACSSSSSPVLMVPENKNYLLKPITFSGPCTCDISVMIKGTIEASSDRSDWNGKNQRNWILFDGVDGLTVGGGGTINGNGGIWWQNSCKINENLPCEDAPTAMTFHSCNNLSMKDLNFRNSQQIHVSFEGCTNVQASSLAITAPKESPNTDGIHITGTRNIQIADCVIGTGDDCISMETGSQSVRATNIVCGPGHGISIGSLGDNGSEAQVSDVTVDGAQLKGTTNGARIKTWQGGRGYARNIKFLNITMDDVENPIIIDQNYCDSKDPCQEQKSAVQVSNVLYENIRGTSSSEVSINFDCSKSIPCEGILLENINLSRDDGDSTRSSCQNVRWTKVGNVVPSPCI